MNRTQIPTADHELSLGGMARWPLPGVVSMTEIRRDPAARCCQQHHYDEPAVRVDSAAGWHTKLDWACKCENQLVTAPVRQSSAAHGPVPRHDLVMAG